MVGAVVHICAKMSIVLNSLSGLKMVLILCGFEMRLLYLILLRGIDHGL